MSDSKSQAPRRGVRRLIVMRHAKSDWSGDGVSDHDRPLNKRGRRDAPEMALWLQSIGCVPDVVLSSSARRTRETWQQMQTVFTTEPEIHFTEALYLAGADEIAEVIRRDACEAENLMVLGHNPGISDFASILAKEYFGMPTAAVIVFESSLDTWHRFHPDSSARLIHSKRPKDL